MRCVEKTGWDDQPDTDILSKWEKWAKNIAELKRLKIARCYVPAHFGVVIKRELHALSDASEIGYGIVIYIRSINQNGDIHCSLVFSKARVAPLKKITNPRLELTAATLAVRLIIMVKRELDFQLGKIMFWTDSTSVLKYISNDRARYHTFVANRIQVIREVTVPTQWRYVSTNTNPADLASRGVSNTQELMDSAWFSEPEFLWKSDSEWPKNVFAAEIEADDPEIKVSCAVIETEEHSVIEELVLKTSTWIKLKKVMAWVLLAKVKFLSLIRTNSISHLNKVHQLTKELLVESEAKILKTVQEKAYSAEIKAIKKNNTVLKGSPLLKFNPVLTSDGLIRIGGRIDKANVSYDMRHPILLPKQSPLAYLIIRDAHQKVGHQGKNAMLAKVRERYWIFGANQLSKRI